MPAQQQRRKRRRLLSIAPAASPIEQADPTEPDASQPQHDDDDDSVGHLSAQGQKLTIRIGDTLTLGRHPHSSLVIQDVHVSSTHAILTAFLSSADEVLVTLKDCSLNGCIVNGFPVRQSTVILLDNDPICIGSLSFVYTQRVKSAFAPTRQPQQQHGDYVILPAALGRGSFAVVCLGVDIVKRRQVACKMIDRQSQNAAYRVRMQREVQVMQQLSHPNLVQLYDAFSTDTHLLLMMQMVTAGDLFSVIERRGCLNVSESKWIAFQMLKGLEYLHSRGIAHRDFKVENCLVDSCEPYPRVLLGDFGTARLEEDVSLTSCGTLSYQAPEVVNRLPWDAGYDGMAQDCWSLGCSVYFCLAGFHPFDSASTARYSDLNNPAEASERQRLVGRILNAEPAWPPQPWSDIESNARSFITSFLDVDPQTRASAIAGLLSPWIRTSKKALSKSYKSRVLDEAR